MAVRKSDHECGLWVDPKVGVELIHELLDVLVYITKISIIRPLVQLIGFSKVRGAAYICELGMI